MTYLSFLGNSSDTMPTAKIAIFLGISGMTYIIGAQFYIHKVPERCKPGFFDIWVAKD